jgi:hypothetical protein
VAHNVAMGVWLLICITICSVCCLTLGSIHAFDMCAQTNQKWHSWPAKLLTWQGYLEREGKDLHSVQRDIHQL